MTNFSNSNPLFRVALIVCIVGIGRTGTAQFATVINVPPEVPPGQVGSDTQLNLMEGSELPSTYKTPFHAGWQGGSSNNLEVNIQGGVIGDWFQAHAGSEVNISGGTVGWRLHANSGSEMAISGGTIGGEFEAYPGSRVNISGGRFGPSFSAHPDSDVTLAGGGFELNGAVIDASSVSLANSDVLSGVLQDGSPFIFSPALGDMLRNVNLASVALPAVSLEPIVVDSEDAPYGIRNGETLTLEEGGVLGEGYTAAFTAVNATLNIDGGRVNGLKAIGSQINFGGGELVGGQFEAFHGSDVIFCGGDSRAGFTARDGSNVTVLSGVIGPHLQADRGSRVTISGGTLDGRLRAYSGSEVTLIGQEFYLDDRPISGLSDPGDRLVLESRDWTKLSGTLSDGSTFSYRTTDPRTLGTPDVFHRNALLTLSLAIPGDFSGNEVLDVADIDFLASEIRNGTNRSQFDLNGDGLVDGVDRTVWVRGLNDTWIGDANLDGEFNSGDLTVVFQAAKYELDEDATWGEGDWTGDGRFDSGDLVGAFQDDGYERGPRTALNAVPEPASFATLTCGLICLLVCQRRNRHIG